MTNRLPDGRVDVETVRGEFDRCTESGDTLCTVWNDGQVVARLDRDTFFALLDEVTQLRRDNATMLEQHAKDCPTRGLHGDDLSMAAIFGCGCRSSVYTRRLEADNARLRSVETAARAVVAHDCMHRPGPGVVMDPCPMCNACADTQAELEDELTEALAALRPQPTGEEK